MRHQQPKHVKPGFLRERAERSDSIFLFHLADRILILMIAKVRSAKPFVKMFCKMSK